MSKPIFNINDYQDTRDVNYAMHCSTYEQAKTFLSYLHYLGKRWCTGDSYVELDRYEMYNGNTCYFFNDGTYADISYKASPGSPQAIFLNFDDFEWEVCSDSKDLILTEKDNQNFNVFMSSFLVQSEELQND